MSQRGAWTAVRASAVFCDLSPLSILAIRGTDAEAFLQGQLSNDVKRLRPELWQATTYNSPKGRVLSNFLLWAGDDGYRALVPQDVAESLRKRLTMYVLRSKVAIADVSSLHARYGLAGPRAHAILTATLGAAPEATGLIQAGEAQVLGLVADRFVVITPLSGAASLVESFQAAAVTAGFALWQWLAVRAGEPTISAATQDQFVLQATNLDLLHGVSFEKGCYTGQEIIARTQYLGRLKERLFGWHLEAGPVEPGARLYSPVFGEQACGTVVNSAAAPDGGTDFLAVVQMAAVAAGDVRLGGLQGPLLAPLTLPYALPEPSSPPRRLA